VNGTINDQISLSSSRLGFLTLYYGDMLYAFRYTQYKDFGGINFPRWFTYIWKPGAEPRPISMRLSEPRERKRETSLRFLSPMWCAAVEPPIRVQATSLRTRMVAGGWDSHQRGRSSSVILWQWSRPR